MKQRRKPNAMRAARYWRFTAGGNSAEPITAAEAAKIGDAGAMGATIVVRASTEAEAYRIGAEWTGLDASDDVGDLAVQWMAGDGWAYVYHLP